MSKSSYFTRWQEFDDFLLQLFRLVQVAAKVTGVVRSKEVSFFLYHPVNCLKISATLKRFSFLIKNANIQIINRQIFMNAHNQQNDKNMGMLLKSISKTI